MATLKAANITKYDAGGSGDNYIADGYIKSVEKVWIDSYAIGTTTLGSDDSIAIGVVPKGKKLTEVVVFLPALLAAVSAATVFLDTGATMLMTAANTFLGSMQADGFATTTINPGTAATLRLDPTKFATEMPKDVTIYMKIMMANGLDLTATSATIRSIIKYT